MKKANTKALIVYVLLIVTLVSFFGINSFGGETVTEEWSIEYEGPVHDWTYDYEGGRDIVVDVDGNVYVTGFSIDRGTHVDYATIKYDSDGNELWVSRYNGPTNGDDEAYAIAIDYSGNIYVTGESEGEIATIKYSNSGNELWAARYNQGRGVDIAVDDLGNVYVTGPTIPGGIPIDDSDYATIKYDGNGTQQWAAIYAGPANGPGSYDGSHAIALDSHGNVLVTGGSAGNNTFCDSTTVKYDNEGNELWVARYTSPTTSGIECTFSVAIDEYDNIYVAGRVWQEDTIWYSHYLTIKYDTEGNEEWVARYNNGEDDVARALAVDNLGNVYVTGYSQGNGTYTDYATIKYDNDGNELWVSRYDGPGNQEDHANDIALDAVGNVYVTGTSRGAGTSLDYATVKYNGNGTQCWVARYNFNMSLDDEGQAIAVDNTGNIYVTGWTGQYKPRWIATIKYSQTVNTHCYGDANEDNVIDMKDITKAERIILQLDSNMPYADANNDGSVDMKDVTKIERIILQIDPPIILNQNK